MDIWFGQNILKVYLPLVLFWGTRPQRFICIGCQSWPQLYGAGVDVVPKGSHPQVTVHKKCPHTGWWWFNQNTYSLLGSLHVKCAKIGSVHSSWNKCSWNRDGLGPKKKKKANSIGENDEAIFPKATQESQVTTSSDECWTKVHFSLTRDYRITGLLWMWSLRPQLFQLCPALP